MKTSGVRQASGAVRNLLGVRPLFPRPQETTDAALLSWLEGRLQEISATTAAARTLIELDPRLQNALLSCAQPLHYGPLERCDSDSVALVRRGSLVEERAMNAQRTQAATLELVEQIERSSIDTTTPRLSIAVYQALLREATLAIGPLAHDLCKRVALLTADPTWLTKQLPSSYPSRKCVLDF